MEDLEEGVASRVALTLLRVTHQEKHTRSWLAAHEPSAGAEVVTAQNFHDTCFTELVMFKLCLEMNMSLQTQERDSDLQAGELHVPGLRSGQRKGLSS